MFTIFKIQSLEENVLLCYLLGGAFQGRSYSISFFVIKVTNSFPRSYPF
jgi:hypothetical protein